MSQKPTHPGLAEVESWFWRRGWNPFPFQREVWQHYLAGKSGLLHAPTGLGKTLAVWMGPLAEALSHSAAPHGLQVLWITPLRALAVDTAQALAEPLADLRCGWEIGSRTGDTTQSQRAKFKARLPAALVTTPESLSLMLSQPEAQGRLSTVRAVIVDEWHELLGSKRGVQTELALARLRRWNPALRLWGLSATLGNLDEARDVLLGSAAPDAVTISSSERKPVEITTLLPEDIGHFPWSGHLGREMASRVLERIQQARTTLLFTNTRSQTEIWFQTLAELQPDLAPDLAMHHGSLDKDERLAVEQRLRKGTVRCVVCTSSLDLGVDFSPVEQVIQLGSPKGIARLLQRAGRSGHRPGAASRVLGVPTNAFELVEFAAARQSLRDKIIESRRPLRQPLDVLVQHLVTIALGGGFHESELRREIHTTHAYRHLTDDEWRWALDFVTTGGHALGAYPDYRKVVIDQGRHQVVDAHMARLHRLSIGTIAADPAVSLRLPNGRRLGSVEEGFIARIRPGGLFIFGGRRLELVRLNGLTATVKDAAKSRKAGQIPSWQGGKSPLSTELAAAVSRKLVAAAAGDRADQELRTVEPILAIQQAWSIIPQADELLIEETRSREGCHVFIFPFAGRLVHEGLATLTAFRLARMRPATIEVSFNDYGFELSSPSDLFVEESTWRQLLSPTDLLRDLHECLDTHELGKRQFREIARVAGLVIQGYPGQPKPARSLQASSGLLYDVFAKYDPNNLLLRQARDEILERQLEWPRLRDTLEALTQRRLIKVHCRHLTPFAFPLWADQLGSSLTTESFTSRLEQMLAQLETAAQQLNAPDHRPEISSSQPDSPRVASCPA